MITNQPDVARKKSKKNVIEINRYLKNQLLIKRIYTCYCKKVINVNIENQI